MEIFILVLIVSFFLFVLFVILKRSTDRDLNNLRELRESADKEAPLFEEDHHPPAGEVELTGKSWNGPDDQSRFVEVQYNNPQGDPLFFAVQDHPDDPRVTHHYEIIQPEPTPPPPTPEEIEAQEQYIKEVQEAADKFNAPMVAKIEAARHHLTGSDWRDPTGKLEMIMQAYEGKRPDYLWFALPKGYKMTQEDMNHLNKLFFRGDAGWGDIELHESLYGEFGIEVALRIRNPRVLVPEVELSGETCPLYLVGHSDIIGRWNYGPCIFFPKLFEQEAEAVTA